MWKIFLRPAMIFFPFLFGALLQIHYRWSWQYGNTDLTVWIIRMILIIMAYFICLQVSLKSLKPHKNHFVIVILNILMGLIPYLILHWMNFEILALVAFFIGVTPTANAAPVIMTFLHGRIGYMLTGFVCTNVFISLALIGLLPWITGQMNQMYITRLTEQLLLLICLPMVTAAITRYFYPKAKDWGRKTKNFNFFLWCMVLFVISAKSTNYFIHTQHLSWGSCIIIFFLAGLICFLNFFIGRIITSKRYCRESSQILGQKNTAFTMFLAISFGGPSGAFIALGPTFYVFWHNMWNAIQIFMYDKRKNEKYRRNHMHNP
ncbi:MAG: hypothetical protein WCS73_09260 [Lentisphaeria bacterium]